MSAFKSKLSSRRWSVAPKTSSRRWSFLSQISTTSRNSTNSETLSGPGSTIFVDEVRKRVMHVYANNAEDFDKNDVHSFIEQNEVEYIERFLLKNKFNVNKTVKMMCDCLKWRKSSGISKLIDNSFPEFFYKYGIAFILGTDLDGDYLLHCRVKLYLVYHPRVLDSFKELFCYLMFKIDKMSASVDKQWKFIFDMSDTTVTQYDVSLAIWALMTYAYKFPSGLKKVFIYNPAWFAKPLILAVIKALPHSISSRLEVVKKEKITNYIAAEQLPKYYGGTNPADPRPVYYDCVDLYKFFSDRFPDTSAVEISKAILKHEKIMATTEW